jgi:hypothetical protein
MPSVELSATDWFVAIGFLALVVGATAVAARLWRAPEGWLEGRLSGIWPYGGPLLRGFVRAFGAITIAAAALPLGLLAGWVVGAEALIVCLGVFLVSWGVAVSVALFNRPRFVVPPPLRQQPGALREWTSRRRADRP